MNIKRHYKKQLSSLDFSLLDVGSGLLFIGIFPDNTIFIFDCNITTESSTEIIDYLKSIIPYRYDAESRENKQWIDIFVNSHRDADHIRGLQYLNEAFPIHEIWDSGQTGASTSSADYQYYMRLRRTVKEKYGDNALKIPRPSTSAVLSRNSLNVFCLNSALDFSTRESFQTLTELTRLVESGLFNEERLKEQHTNSIALVIEYDGFRILLAGDTDWLSWRDYIIPKFARTGLLKADILIASHHGSRSFFTSEQNEHIDEEQNPDTTYLESIRYIDPTVTLIPCGDYVTYHHPNKEAMDIYKRSSKNEQVYTTNKWGNIEGIKYKNSSWALLPTMFSEKNSHLIDIEAKCNGLSLHNESVLALNNPIQFSVKPKEHGLFEPYNEITIRWSVNNSGEENDSEHHEIYNNQDDEKNKPLFKRDLVFMGKHILRCYIYNKKKGKKVVKLFTINGQ